MRVLVYTVTIKTKEPMEGMRLDFDAILNEYLDPSSNEELVKSEIKEAEVPND